jgi:hypothetical protein
MATSNIDFMMTYVKDYLDGKMERWAFDLDFDRHIIERHAKMERENPALAEAYGFYISECGVDCGNDLSDADFKKMIRRQYNALKATMRDGLW